MTEAELVLQEVSQKADSMTDEVLCKLIDKLTAIIDNYNPLDCKKHTVLQAYASIAAIKLWRIEKKRTFRWQGGGWTHDIVHSSDHDYVVAASIRDATSREYHEAECTCGLTRKERRQLISVENLGKENEHVG